MRHTWQTSLLWIARFNVCRRCVLVWLFTVKTLSPLIESSSELCVHRGKPTLNWYFPLRWFRLVSGRYIDQSAVEPESGITSLII